jgi:hypothetical protein
VGDNDHLKQAFHNHSSRIVRGLGILEVPGDLRSKVVIVKSANMDIALDHFKPQAGPNGVASSADLHLEGALHKRS